MAVVLQESDYLQQVYYDLAGALPAGPAQDDVTTRMMTALQARLPVMWAMQASGTKNIYLRYLYLKRQSIILLIGQLRLLVDAMLGRGGLRLSRSQAVRNLGILLKATDDEIKSLEARLRANGGFVVGQLTQTIPGRTIPVSATPMPVTDPSQPVPALGWSIDPNSPLLEGNPAYWDPYDPAGGLP